MADKNTIKNWFKTNLKPTQAQFWALFDSYRHNDEKIPITAIDDIENILADKADGEVLAHHLTAVTAHADLFDAKEDKSKRGAALGYAPLNEFTKLAIDYLNVVNDLVTGGADSLLTAEQGKLLQVQITAINTLLTSDNVNLDNVQEIVDAIETVQTSLSTILVNDLTSGGTTKALTAEMGKTLKGLIDGFVVPAATDTVRGIVKTDVPTADPVVYLKTTTDNLLKAKVNAILEIKPITGIAYTLIAYDTANLVQLAYDGTLPMTVTIPNDATLNLPVGSIFYTVGSNTGALTIAGGAGVTFQSAVGLTAGQNETRKYVKKYANVWGIEGSATAGISPNQVNIFTADQKFRKKVIIGSIDGQTIEEDGVSSNPRVYKTTSLASNGTVGNGWGARIENWLGGSKIWQYESYGYNVSDATFSIFSPLKVWANTIFTGIVTLKGLVFDGTYAEILKSWSSSTDFNFKINHSVTNPSSYVDFTQINTPGGGWSNYFRFIMKAYGAGTQFTALELYSDGSEAYATVDGVLKMRKLNLSQLGAYADDSAASAAGVAVGFAYINSTTGALHRRLT